MAERIKQARLRMGLEQEDVAQALGVSVRSVVAWERGETTPRPKKQRELSKLTGRPVSYFVDDEPPPEEPPNAPPAAVGEPEPGVVALLADRALCDALCVTDGQRALLLLVRAGGYIATVQQAVRLLDAIKSQ